MCALKVVDMQLIRDQLLQGRWLHTDLSKLHYDYGLDDIRAQTSQDLELENRETKCIRVFFSLSHLLCGKVFSAPIPSSFLEIQN